METPDVVDAVSHHHQTIEAQAEGEAVVDVRIDAAEAQNVGVSHAAGQKFHPARAFADAAARAVADKAVDVQLESRLHEGKEAGAQADFHVACEDLREEGFLEVDEVGHGDAGADEHAFHLVEHRFMRGVGGFASEHFARGDEAEGRGFLGFHAPNLDGGGVGAQQVLHVLEPEGVLHVPRRVGFGDVQGGEVVPVVLNVGSVEDVEAHGEEDVLEFPLHDAHRVQTRFLHRFGPQGAAQGDVGPVGGECGIRGGAFDSSSCLFQGP